MFNVQQVLYVVVGSASIVSSCSPTTVHAPLPSQVKAPWKRPIRVGSFVRGASYCLCIRLLPVLFPFFVGGGGGGAAVYSIVSSGGTFHSGGLFRGGGSGTDGGSDNCYVSSTPGRGGGEHACVGECSCCRQRPCRGSQKLFDTSCSFFVDGTKGCEIICCTLGNRFLQRYDTTACSAGFAAWRRERERG